MYDLHVHNMRLVTEGWKWGWAIIMAAYCWHNTSFPSLCLACPSLYIQLVPITYTLPRSWDASSKAFPITYSLNKYTKHSLIPLQSMITKCCSVEVCSLIIF